MTLNVHHIPRKTGSNPPGLQAIYLFFADQVISSDPLELKPGALAYSLFTADLDASVEFSTTVTAAYEMEISLSYPGSNETLAFIRKHFVKRQFLLISEYLTGEIRMVGTKNFPLSCKVSGDNVYKVSFSGLVVDNPQILLGIPDSVPVEALARRTGPNPKGILNVNILFADEVISIPEPNENDVIDANPEVETSELLKYYTGDMDSSYDLDIELEDAGVIYSHKLAIKIPDIDSGLDQLMARFRNKQIILIIEDFFQEEYLIGSVKHPLEVSLKYDSGGDSGFRGYTLTFEGKTDEPPYKFEGALTPVAPPAPPVPIPAMIDFDPNDFSSEDFY